MIDAITYTSSLPAFRQWLADNAAVWPKHIGIDENGAYILLSKTPTFSNGNHSISLVRVESMSFINASPLEILAQCPMGGNPFTLMDADARQKYSLAYPRPIITVPESTFMGNVRPSYTYQRPEIFGGFA